MSSTFFVAGGGAVVIDIIKKMSDEDKGDKVRLLLEAHPQLVNALTLIQVF